MIATRRLVEAFAAEEGSGVVARCVREALHAVAAFGVLPGGTGVRTRRGGILPGTPAHEGIAVLTRRVYVAGHPAGTFAIQPGRAREGTCPRRLVEAHAAEGRQVPCRVSGLGRSHITRRVREAGEILRTVT